MSWYAVRALDDALSETKELLLPFDLATWVRLAVITAFAGFSAPQTPTFSWEVPPETAFDATRNVSVSEALAVVAVVAAVLLVVALVVAVIGAVMEFVLVDVVRTRDVRIAAPFRARLGAGLRLFGFRLALILAMGVAGAVLLGPIALAALGGTPVWLLLLVVTGPLFLVAAAATAVVSEFTTAFVVPLMVDENVGVLDGWRALWPEVRGDWQQFGIYALVKVVLLFGASVVLGFALAVVAIPVGVGGFFVESLTGLSLVTLGLAAVLGVVVLAAVSVPTMTFLRYHSLCTLDRSSVEFALR